MPRRIGALHGGDIVHHISRDTRVLVAEIQPDAIAAQDAAPRDCCAPGSRDWPPSLIPETSQ